MVQEKVDIRKKLLDQNGFKCEQVEEGNRNIENLYEKNRLN